MTSGYITGVRSVTIKPITLQSPLVTAEVELINAALEMDCYDVTFKNIILLQRKSKLERILLSPHVFYKFYKIDKEAKLTNPFKTATLSILSFIQGV